MREGEGFEGKNPFTIYIKGCIRSGKSRNGKGSEPYLFIQSKPWSGSYLEDIGWRTLIAEIPHLCRFFLFLALFLCRSNNRTGTHWLRTTHILTHTHKPAALVVPVDNKRIV